MQLETAVKQIQQESEFLGMNVLAVMEDIEKQGRMVYSEKTVEAFNTVRIAGAKFFAPYLA